jgi:hypothetical protein
MVGGDQKVARRDAIAEGAGLDPNGQHAQRIGEASGDGIAADPPHWHRPAVGGDDAIADSQCLDLGRPVRRLNQGARAIAGRISRESKHLSAAVTIRSNDNTRVVDA